MASISFLGTSAGVAATLIDCAEGTQRQLLFLQQRTKQWVSRAQSKASNQNAISIPLRQLPPLKRIFITHLHMDHVNGLPILLVYLMNNFGGAKIEIFGPPGLRRLVRTILTLTCTTPMHNAPDIKYCVHELVRSPEDASSSCSKDELHVMEAPGRDILCGPDGIWSDFAAVSLKKFSVSAASIEHRAPCYGYTFTIPQPGGIHPPTKIVYLGDTSDPSGLATLAQDATLLIHEATLAHIPLSVNPKGGGHKTTPASMREKAIEKGHSTPEMAGEFAKRVGAKNLVLNHFSARYAYMPRGPASATMFEIERLASVAWGGGKARAAHDFLRVDISSEGSMKTTSL